MRNRNSIYGNANKYGYGSTEAFINYNNCNNNE